MVQGRQEELTLLPSATLLAMEYSLKGWDQFALQYWQEGNVHTSYFAMMKKRDKLTDGCMKVDFSRGYLHLKEQESHRPEPETIGSMMKNKKQAMGDNRPAIIRMVDFPYRTAFAVMAHQRELQDKLYDFLNEASGYLSIQEGGVLYLHEAGKTIVAASEIPAGANSGIKPLF